MLIKKDPDIIASYLQDYSNIKNGFCDSVLFPETEDEISRLLIEASSKKTPITISAAGTGVTGGRIPFGGCALSTEKLNKVLDIKRLATGEGEAAVEAGVVLQDFLDNIEKGGFFYPPNPTEKSSFIGGNIATSASGARSFKFGTTRDYVLGLRVVLSSGETVDIERGRVFADDNAVIELPLVSGKVIKFSIPGYTMPHTKNAAGYYAKKNMDAIDIFIGQEGTLGVITQARLKLLGSLKGLIDCYAFFKRQEDALSFVYRARHLSTRGRNTRDGIDAISLEFFDKNALKLLRERHKDIPEESQGAVYFEQEADKESECRVIDSWAKLIGECGGLVEETWFAQTKKEQQRLQDVRHDLPDLVNEFIKRDNLTKVGTDIAVTPDKIDDMINYYNTTLDDAGLRYVIFGHLGDCHLHVNILPADFKQHQKAKDIYNLFVKRGVSLGGTISAEHGIGKAKHSYLEMMYGKGALKEMAALKRCLDPACILGLDNIFPKELLI